MQKGDTARYLGQVPGDTKKWRDAIVIDISDCGRFTKVRATPMGGNVKHTFWCMTKDVENRFKSKD